MDLHRITSVCKQNTALKMYEVNPTMPFWSLFHFKMFKHDLWFRSMPKTKPVSFKEQIRMKDFPRLFHTQPLKEADLREIE